jgi:hypothetical protein
VVIAARHIAQTGEYVASRLPGYPVHEYLTALTPAKTSPLLSNGITASFSGAASLFFALILRRFRIEHYPLLTLAFALTPIVYVNSVSTMDYVLALAFLLGSTYSVIVHRPLSAGVLLGLAIGSRITSGAMLLPLAVWIFFTEDWPTSGRQFMILSLTGLVVGSVCYLPVVGRYGLGFFAFHEFTGYPSLRSLPARASLGVWGASGTLGFLGLCCAVPFVLREVVESLSRPLVRQGLALSTLSIALYVVAYLRLPHEVDYLMPVVPFVILALALLIPSYIVRFFGIALLVSSFVAVGSGGVTLRGPIVRNHSWRQSQLEQSTEIIESVDRLPGNSVVVAGWKLPPIRVLGGDQQRNHQYVYLIEDSAAFTQYIEEGFRVYFVPGMDGYNLRTHGIDLIELGAEPLDLPRQE